MSIFFPPKGTLTLAPGMGGNANPKNIHKNQNYLDNKIYRKKEVLAALGQ